MKRRALYAITALILFGIEACIALFVHDNFVRPYIGDVLVVILIHCAVRVVVPPQTGKDNSEAAAPHRRWLPVYVFAFACLVELTQYVRLLDLLGLGHVGWLRIVIGGTFDWADIACYVIGCAAVGLVEWLCRRHKP